MLIISATFDSVFASFDSELPHSQLISKEAALAMLLGPLSAHAHAFLSFAHSFLSRISRRRHDASLYLFFCIDDRYLRC